MVYFYLKEIALYLKSKERQRGNIIEGDNGILEEARYGQLENYSRLTQFSKTNKPPQKTGGVCSLEI